MTFVQKLFLAMCGAATAIGVTLGFLVQVGPQ
jgi:hypothetical protein